MKSHALAIMIYALLIIIGGVMGFAKAHSLVSLIVGSFAGILLISSSVGIYYSHSWGLYLAFAVTSVLLLFFGYRYFGKMAFFPSGMMALLSVATLLCLWLLPRK